jgi:hypothetical protein
VKKALSILVVLLLLTAIFHISVARHYCGGELADIKVSLSGDLASCTMQGTEECCPLDSPGDYLKYPCCDDIVTFYSIDNNNTPPSVATVTYRFTTQVLDMPFPLPLPSQILSSHVFTDVSPPVFILYTSVDLTNICVFRI